MLAHNKIIYSDTICQFYHNATGSKGKLASKEIRFVGQEQDGTLLFHWHDWSPGQIEGEDGERKVSFVGAYNPHKQDVKTVFIHDQKANVINASINKEHTFLAFTTVNETEVTGLQGRAVKQDVYKAFIAEIQPQNRVFYLNLERQNYIKLQFLYGKYRSQKASRESHLLIFLHKESVGLYHLPVGRVGEEGFIMSGEPKKDQLFHRRFVWMQFDAAYQRLYLIYFKKHGKNEKRHAVPLPYFTAYQFVEGTLKTAELVLDMQLDLPVPYMKDSTKSTYLQLGPYHSIPDSSMNIEVLTSSGGAFCVCFQHIPDQKSKVKAEPTMMQYSVCVLHKEKTIHCQCFEVPEKVIQHSRICFAWIDGYLMAYLAGHFTHLLNVGAEFDLSLHIMFRETSRWKDLPPTLVQFCGDKQLHSHSGVSLFDSLKCEAVRLSIDYTCLLELFKECTYLATRAAILHYATVQARDLVLTKQIIEHLCMDPSCFDVVQLLEEYLAGSMYCLLAKQVERSLLRYLPYTATETSIHRGQVFCQDSEERICSVSYSQAGEVTLEESTLLTEDQFWNLLSGHIKDRQWAINCRFNLFDVKIQTEDVPSGLKFQFEAEQTQSFFQRISSVAKVAFSGRPSTQDEGQHYLNPQRIFRPPSRVDVILGKQPAFLKRDEEYLKNERYFSKTVEVLSAHLLNFLTQESRTKIRTIAEECVRCQTQACRLLCHAVWGVLGVDHDEDRTLSERGDKWEIDLFAMYEKIYMAAETLSFPLPSGFDTFFIRLGYRCQTDIEFRQYLEKDIYRLSPTIVLVFLRELTDTEFNVELKWQLIQKLSKESAIECLHHWQHPSAQQCVAEAYISQVIEHKAGSKAGDSSKRKTKSKYSRQRTQEVPIGQLGEQALFPALQSLIKFIEAKDDLSKTNSDSTRVSVDTELLKQTALTYFK